MKNREKFREEIVKAIKDGDSCDFMIKTVNPLYSDGWECNNELCQRDECEACLKLFAFWLGEEYEEPEEDYRKERNCEWIKYDSWTICPKHHDANNPYWRIPENTDKLKYCPYCGKKITIVKGE